MQATMILASAAALTLLAACHRADPAPGPGDITAAEAQELNDAAAMLDANANAVTANEDVPR